VGVLNCSNRLSGPATTFMFYVLIYNAHCSFGNGSIMTVRLLKRLPRIALAGPWNRQHLLGITATRVFDFPNNPVQSNPIPPIPGHNKSPILEQSAVTAAPSPVSSASCNFRRHSPGVRRIGEINKVESQVRNEGILARPNTETNSIRPRLRFDWAR